MHPSSMENMYKCYQRYVASEDGIESPILVLDIGGVDINGSYRDIFSSERFVYQSADTDNNSNPDIHLPDNYRLPIETESFDIVLCGQTLEHCEYFWLLFDEMVRVLNPRGMLFLIVPSAGPIHRFPVDCYRFYPDFLLSMAKYTKCHLIDSWIDPRGPWRDLTGVFCKAKVLPFNSNIVAKNAFEGNDYEKNTGLVQDWSGTGNYHQDVTAGSEEYTSTLQRVHREIAPQLYLEIGIRKGLSLDLSNCNTIAIDPAPEISEELPKNHRVYQMTSDHFFEFHAELAIAEQKVDLAFIDGLHLFEFALRDFINIEKYSSPTSIIIIDDILPSTLQQASRIRQTRVWTGDVWKIIFVLRKYRPELRIKILDCHPTGLMVVSRLDKTNKVLENNYNQIIRQSEKTLLSDYSLEVLERGSAMDPKSVDIAKL